MTIGTIGVAIPSIPPREFYLRRALRSVEAQIRPADDVKVVIDHEGRGATITRNEAWRALDTDWVAFLDDDDEFLPHHLLTLELVAEDTGADFVYPWHRIIDRDGVSEIPTLWPGVQGAEFDPDRLFGKPGPHTDPYDIGPHGPGPEGANNYIPMTVLVRRSLLEEVGGFEDLGDAHVVGAGNEDWLTWRKMVCAGAKIVHTPEITWLWHHHGANTSGLGNRWTVGHPSMTEAPL